MPAANPDALERTTYSDRATRIGWWRETSSLTEGTWVLTAACGPVEHPSVATCGVVTNHSYHDAPLQELGGRGLRTPCR